MLTDAHSLGRASARTGIAVLCVFLFLSFSGLVHAQAPKPGVAKPAAKPEVVKPAPKPEAAKPDAKAKPGDAAAEAGEDEKEPPFQPKEEDPVDREMRFASGLVDWRMPDIAEKFLGRYLPQHPEAKPKAGAVRIKIYAVSGKFDKAEQEVKALPPDSMETLYMRLALAEQYYFWGKMKEAKVHYDAFFKKYPQGPPEDLRTFFMEQAYKYSQMLMFKNDQKSAIEALGYVLLCNPEKEIKRQIQCDMAELCVKASEQTTGKDREEYFKKVRALCDDLMWKDQDLFFAKAAVLIAHMEMMKGDRKGAQNAINTYLPMLQDFDKWLKENGFPAKMSPMPECRYLLGALYEEEGQALLEKGNDKEAREQLEKALKHFYNVFLKYPASNWAPEAGARAERVKARCESKGWKIVMPKVDLKPIIDAQFREAQSLFQEQNYQEAAEKFRAVLNFYPEQESSVASLRDLGKCYVNLNDPAFSQVVMGYLAERFSRNEKLTEVAGNALLDIAKEAEDINNKDMGRKAYDLFFKHFSEHKRVASMLFQFGEEKYREENYDLALGYYQQIVTNYPKSRVYVPAMNRIAYCYAQMKDYTNAAEVLTRYASEVQRGPLQIDAWYRLAEVNRQLDKLVPAINKYHEVIQALTGPDKAVYSPTPDDVTRHKAVMQGAMFWKPYCYARLKGAKDEVKKYQEKAIEDFTKYLADYPQSERASMVLGRVGILLNLVGKPDESAKAFDRLTRDYPNSPEAKDIIFVQYESLLELGQTEKAVQTAQKMIENEKKYTSEQFLRVARTMYDSRQYEAGAKFFEQAKIKAGDDRRVWEPAVLGVGQCYFAMTNHADAAKAIEELTKKYPTTGYLVDACFILSRSYAEIGGKEPDKDKRFDLFNMAIKSINKLRIVVATDVDLRAKSEHEIADIQLLKGKKEEAAATYGRMILLYDANNPKLRPHIERAFEKAGPLMLELQLYRDLMDNCQLYLDQFPNGRLVVQARKWRDEAKMKLAMTGATIGTPTEIGPKPPPEEAAPTETEPKAETPAPPEREAAKPEAPKAEGPPAETKPKADAAKPEPKKADEPKKTDEAKKAE